MGKACSMYGGRRGVYRVVMGKPEGKRPFGEPRCSLEDNIEMDLQEVEWGTGSNRFSIGTGGGHLRRR